VTQETEQRATLVLGLRAEDLFAIANGDLAPMQAYTDERVTVKGDMGLAMQLLDLFNVGAASVPYLIPLLQSEDVETRVYGLEALGKSGGRNVIPAVKRLLDDPDERVCDAAKRSLEAVSARTPQKRSAPDSNLALGTVELTGQSPGGKG
jgi:HEAT repeat protein